MSQSRQTPQRDCGAPRIRKDEARSKMSSGAALGMFAFADLFNDLGAEGFEVARVARRNDPVIDHDFRIFPFRPGVGDVCLDRLVRRHLSAFGDAGFDQQPRRMANRGNDLLLVGDVLDEGERSRFHA
jgi:hypothetical protein